MNITFSGRPRPSLQGRIKDLYGNPVSLIKQSTVSSDLSSETIRSLDGRIKRNYDLFKRLATPNKNEGKLAFQEINQNLDKVIRTLDPYKEEDIIKKQQTEDIASLKFRAFLQKAELYLLVQPANSNEKIDGYIRQIQGLIKKTKTEYQKKNQQDLDRLSQTQENIAKDKFYIKNARSELKELQEIKKLDKDQVINAVKAYLSILRARIPILTAFKYFPQAEALANRLDDKNLSTVQILKEKGRFYSLVKDRQKAMDCLQKALNIIKENHLVCHDLQKNLKERLEAQQKRRETYYS